MAILVASETSPADKNYWATDPECFADAEHLYGRKFQIDMAAEPQTTKVNRYMLSPQHYDVLSGKQHSQLPSAGSLRQSIAVARAAGSICVGFDALTTAWEEDWWCNPPFDLKVQFISSARRAQRRGVPGMMLLPYEPLTQWWRKALERDVVIYEPDGRYNFMERDGETKKSGVNFGSALVVFPSFRVGQSIRIPFERGIGTKAKKKKGGVKLIYVGK